jgi:hypothetical protein
MRKICKIVPEAKDNVINKQYNIYCLSKSEGEMILSKEETTGAGER